MGEPTGEREVGGELGRVFEAIAVDKGRAKENVRVIRNSIDVGAQGTHFFAVKEDYTLQEPISCYSS